MVKSPKNDYFEFIDILRGVAIIIVCLFHVLSFIYGFDNLKWDGNVRSFDAPISFLVLLPLTFGWIGVPIFFVISGFCIHLSHMRSPDPGWKVFFVRRFFRIYPPYFIALLVFFLVSVSFSFGNRDRVLFKVTDFLVHAAGVHNLHGKFLTGLTPALWSIAVEIQLYAIYPLLCFCTAKVGWRKMIGVTFFLEAGIRLVRLVCAIKFGIKDLPLEPAFVFYLPFASWFSWSVGAYIAQCKLEKRTCELTQLPFWPVLGIAVLSSFFFFSYFFSFLLFALAAAVLCAKLVVYEEGEARPVYPLVVRWMVPFGIISYSLYLLHYPFIEVVARILKKLDFSGKLGLGGQWVIYLLLLVFVSGLAWLYYRFVEKPFIAMGRRYIAKIAGRKRPENGFLEKSDSI